MSKREPKGDNPWKETDPVEWVVGYCDYLNGRNIDECPYDEVDNIEYSLWKEGWEFCKEEKAG